MRMEVAMAAEDEIRQASEQFYAALNRTLDGGDSGPMEQQIWSQGSDVSAMHPFGGRMLGWEEVGASWEQVAIAKPNSSDSICCRQDVGASFRPLPS
jgi:hypothetical protein